MINPLTLSNLVSFIVITLLVIFTICLVYYLATTEPLLVFILIVLGAVAVMWKNN